MCGWLAWLLLLWVDGAYSLGGYIVTVKLYSVIPLPAVSIGAGDTQTAGTLAASRLADVKPAEQRQKAPTVGAGGRRLWVLAVGAGAGGCWLWVLAPVGAGGRRLWGGAGCGQNRFLLEG